MVCVGRVKRGEARQREGKAKRMQGKEKGGRARRI
jgi:hypothetical protein